MSAGRMFVVAVASEKGGVGKTTIATNLAVYLKALDEDLPVTIASFDNHFSVDSMFAIGGREGASVVGLFEGRPLEEVIRLGEYGVQFLASERRLVPPDDDPDRLRRVLGHSGLSGIFLVDTRPILDYFTCNALRAADLVLVPVKDRASLVNAAAIRNELREAGGGERLWLVPSLIDARLRLRGRIGMREFLAFSGRERGYQVLDVAIPKSPKVESLATNLTSRVYPVLTHARYTAAHHEFRKLARFVREQHTRSEDSPRHFAADIRGAVPDRKRLLAECPACGKAAASGSFFFDARSRRRGLVHEACLQRLFGPIGLGLEEHPRGILAVETWGRGIAGPEEQSRVHLFSQDGHPVDSTSMPEEAEDLAGFLGAATGRLAEELCREVQLLTLAIAPAERFLTPGSFREWTGLGKTVLREVLAEK